MVLRRPYEAMQSEAVGSLAASPAKGSGSWHRHLETWLGIHLESQTATWPIWQWPLQPESPPPAHQETAPHPGLRAPLATSCTFFFLPEVFSFVPLG